MARNEFRLLFPVRAFVVGFGLRDEKSSSVKNRFLLCSAMFSFFSLVRSRHTMPMDLQGKHEKLFFILASWHSFNNWLRPLPVLRASHQEVSQASQIFTLGSETPRWQTRQECARWLWWWLTNHNADPFESLICIPSRIGVKSCTFINKSKSHTRKGH